MPSDKKKNELSPSSGSDEEVGEVFEVDRILKKRQRNGKTEYLIRWKGFGPEEDSWEPPSNLEGCPEIVDAFEKKFSEKMRQQKSGSGEPSPRSSATPTASDPSAAPTGAKRKSSGGGGKPDSAEGKRSKESSNASATPMFKTGFDRNYEPEKIIGATDSTGELMFLIKWKNLEEAELVPAKVANKKCPHVVISFYEERLTWTGPTND